MKTREDCAECEYVRFSWGPVCSITRKASRGVCGHCPKEGPLSLYAAAHRWSKIRGGYVIAHSMAEARYMYSRAVGYTSEQIRVVDLKFSVNDGQEHGVYLRDCERLKKMGVQF